MLRKVERDEAARKTFREAAFSLVERDEAAASNSSSSRPLARAGVAQQQGRKILHAVPKVAIVPAHVVSKHIGPKMSPQCLHRVALADQPVQDEVERTAQLKK